MPTVDHQIHEHDVVRLRHPIEGWPAGREGTVVAEKAGWKLIEIADGQGAMLALIPVRDDGLNVIWTPLEG